MIPHFRGFRGRGIRFRCYFKDMRSSLPLIDTVKVILGANPVFWCLIDIPKIPFPLLAVSFTSLTYLHITETIVIFCVKTDFYFSHDEFHGYALSVSNHLSHGNI